MHTHIVVKIKRIKILKEKFTESIPFTPSKTTRDSMKKPNNHK